MWREIAESDLEVWYSLIRVIPGIYDERSRRKMKERETFVERDGAGTIIHYFRGQVHRDEEDGPAIISERVEKYYSKGELHRNDGPAVTFEDGTIMYFSRGVRHRDPRVGPAVHRANGDVEYWWRGMLHRHYEDGPALHWPGGEILTNWEGSFMTDLLGNPITTRRLTKYYWKGELHRDPKLGPAVITDRKEKYYWRGVLYRDPREGSCVVYR